MEKTRKGIPGFFFFYLSLHFEDGRGKWLLISRIRKCWWNPQNLSAVKIGKRSWKKRAEGGEGRKGGREEGRREEGGDGLGNTAVEAGAGGRTQERPRPTESRRKGERRRMGGRRATDEKLPKGKDNNRWKKENGKKEREREASNAAGHLQRPSSSSSSFSLKLFIFCKTCSVSIGKLGNSLALSPFGLRTEALLIYIWSRFVGRGAEICILSAFFRLCRCVSVCVGVSVTSWICGRPSGTFLCYFPTMIDIWFDGIQRISKGISGIFPRIWPSIFPTGFMLHENSPRIARYSASWRKKETLESIHNVCRIPGILKSSRNGHTLSKIGKSQPNSIWKIFGLTFGSNLYRKRILNKKMNQ